ncbi:MAG: hypothetical protein M1832_005044 [Thelocarpon impressellum]|nr:MAG: hypothetical protein M1832_005044 [Thelocarpon impressellum]
MAAAEPTQHTPGPEDSPVLLPQGSRLHKAPSARRLAGRPAKTSRSSLQSLGGHGSVDFPNTGLDTPEMTQGAHLEPHHSRRHRAAHSGLVAQITDWLKHERARRVARKAKGEASKGEALPGVKALTAVVDSASPITGASRERRFSDSSQGSEALERLEEILKESLSLGENFPKTSSTPGSEKRPSPSRRRRPSISRKLKRNSTAGSSDSEYIEADVLVPSCDVVLDNSRTLTYTGGAASSQTDLSNPSERASKDREGWKTFKSEIVRLAHTLRLKGWRNVPQDLAGEVSVERLSGALTNAVYVVAPPKDLPPPQRQESDSNLTLGGRRAPPKLLLRIYGPQVEQLIDRESELQILRRLARKSIGPRLLGTFKNGRFEQFFNAQTLTAHDLRVPATSVQIAKRMRELHDGIELLEEERDAGPFVWRNWDKWLDKCGAVVSWLDRKIVTGTQGKERSKLDAWKKRGLLLGVEWPVFKEAVERYRRWLYERYGGEAGIRPKLVFAHNDTQYGNLLRLQPSGESPLLLPANEHKQLVVIDFEYASANQPGLEFANHFSEWCYNYHHPKTPFVLNHLQYPTVPEQVRFVKAYVEHSYTARRTSATPAMTASPGPSNSISAFMLDSRASAPQVTEEEQQREKATNETVEQYMEDTRLWRAANSAQWVAWGVVQAKVSGLEAEKAKEHAGSTRPEASADEAAGESDHAEHPEDMADDDDDQDEFDYLSYAQERAMMFWGDMLTLGLVEEKNLPASLLPKLKIIGR